MKYLCTVGDSFLQGHGLIETHCMDQIPNVPLRELNNILYTGRSNLNNSREIASKISDLLAPMTLSGIVADRLQMKNLNFSQGGASMEGILLQMNLLIAYLDESNISLNDTYWLIGVTSSCRKMFFHRNVASDTSSVFNNTYYRWSKGTMGSLILSADASTQPLYPKELIKEMQKATTDVSMVINWTLHLNSMITLLQSKGINDYLLLNIFSAPIFTLSNMLSLNESERQMLFKLRVPINEKQLLPSEDKDFYVMLPHDRCPDGHLNKVGHEKMAEIIINQIRKNKNEMVS